MSKVRNYCFTSFRGKIEFNDKMKYLLQGVERCPSTGREHIQGFVIFKNPRALGGVIKEFPNINFEICKGNIQQNRDYCMKEGAFTEEGEVPVGPGARTDLITVAEMIRQGATATDIINTVELDGDGKTKDYGMDYIRYNKGIDKMINLVRLKPRNWEMDVRIYWGEPGTGKTRAVHEEFGENVYPKMVGKWWDGYEGQECVLIDDFDPANCYEMAYDFYLKLLDRYKLLIEMKGSSGNFCSKVIIFTSNFNPEHWFPNKANRGAFFRRVKEIRYFPRKENCAGGTEHGTEVGGGNNGPPHTRTE